MIFCSGDLFRCRALRKFIRSQDTIDYEAISTKAKEMWGPDVTDTSTGLFICTPDNKLIGMLSAHNFKVVELPWNRTGLDIQVLGFKMQEAYTIACQTAKTANHGLDVVLATFQSVNCEEVGGTLHVFARLSGSDEVSNVAIPLQECYGMRKRTFLM